MTKIRSFRGYRVYMLFICALVISKLDCRRCIMYTQRLHFQPAGGDSRTELIIYRRTCAHVSEFYAANWSGRSEFMKFVQASRVSDRQTTRLFARAAFLSQIELCASRNNRVGLFAPSDRAI